MLSTNETYDFAGLQLAEVPTEQQKLQFGRTMLGAREQILKAQKALDKVLFLLFHSNISHPFLNGQLIR